MVHLHGKILLIHKKIRIMTWEEKKWMEVEIIILNKISQIYKDKCHVWTQDLNLCIYILDINIYVCMMKL